ncbi:MAG: DUF362 domain-containing protein [Candidatus Lokiarchaeota archaeon]|nr:DUF362 domain-containing protein [Candidatus Lokiarchaeota archaeon]
MSRNKIAIQKVYHDDVKSAVFSALELINAKDMMNREGMTVLLKPNLLSAKKPELAATTHPKVVKAVIHWVKQFNPAKIYVCDSSGGGMKPGTTERAMIASELKQVCDEEGDKVECIPFEATEREIYKVKNPLELNEFPSSKLIKEADLIINLPKIKTHNQCTLTCCIKNMFGTILRSNKAKTHAQFPSLNRFTSALADIYSVSNPQLTVIDGYLAMEGSGPGSGDPVKLDLIIAGYDGVALDTVVCKITEIPVEDVRYLAFAEQKGLGTTDITKIEILGESIGDVRRKFKLPSGIQPVSAWLPRKVADYISKIVFKARIGFDADKCILCGTCWENCPVGAINPPKMRKKGSTPIWDKKKCITCFCCHELCPEAAVTLKVPIAKNAIFSWLGLAVLGFIAVIGATLSLLLILL